jgi:hypothetical protein
MSPRWLLWGLLWSVCISCGTWLLAQKSQGPISKHESQVALYSICKTSNSDLLLDALHGKTWMLRGLENGDANWLPIPRIDSESEEIKL